MVKLMMGLKGTGKTKTLIDKVNAAVTSEHGDVLCIEKGDKLRYDIDHKARLISTDEYGIIDYDMFYGFLCGLVASNYDTTAIYIDSITKICRSDDIGELEKFLDELQTIQNNIKIFITVSSDINNATDKIKEYFE